jgi:hypothetical protein
MRQNHLLEPDFFAIREQQAALKGCLPCIKRWAAKFIAEIESLEAL